MGNRSEAAKKAWIKRARKKKVKTFRHGKTEAFIKKEYGKYTVYHYYDRSLQYQQSYNKLKDALGDLNCLISEFKPR